MQSVTQPLSSLAIRERRPQIANVALTLVICLSTLGAMASTAPWLVLASGATLSLIILLLWQGDDPPILLLPALFQWTEVAIVPISTIWLKIPLSELSPFGADINRSSIYGLLGISALAIGMAVGKGRSQRPSFMARLREEAERWPVGQTLAVSLILVVGGYGLIFLSGVAGPLREPLNQASGIKYIGLFLLTFLCLTRKRNYGILLAVMFFEVGFGLTGFFADFKNSILTFFVAAITARPKTKITDLFIVSFAGSLILVVAVFWSAIKPDYRDFVNKGTGAQIIAVPLSERIDFLADSAGRFDEQMAADGFQRLVARHGYVEFLGLVMTYMPSSLPYQNGEITMSVVRHITVPRILWPEKPVLANDTEIMSKLTGLPMTWNEDTSISVGYLAELYADFGYIGGLISAFMIGFIVGLAYRFTRNQFTYSAIICAGLCLLLALPIAYFGTAYVKMVGAFVMSFVVVLILGRFAMPVLLTRTVSPVR
jgi:hypothetical protein